MSICLPRVVGGEELPGPAAPTPARPVVPLQGHILGEKSDKMTAGGWLVAVSSFFTLQRCGEQPLMAPR